MSKRTILDWDIWNLVKEKVAQHRFLRLNFIDVTARVHAIVTNAAALPAAPIKQLQPGPVIPIRVELDFNGPELSHDEEMMIADDPLLHQRIVDAVQEPFRKAADQIAAELIAWDRDPAPKSTEAGHLQKIRGYITAAQQAAPIKVRPLLTQFENEMKGASKYRWNMALNLVIGTTSVVLGCVTIGLTIASAGVAAVGVGAIIATTRGGLDLIKSFRDVWISAQTLESRLGPALDHVRKEAKKGSQAFKVFLGGTIKIPSLVGYAAAGNASFASVADLKNDCKLYEDKLMEIRDTVHGLAREIPKLLDKIKAEEASAASKTREIKWHGEKFDSNYTKMKLIRTKREEKLHNLLEKVIEFEKGWRTSSLKKGKVEWNWQAKLDGIKEFQNHLNQALIEKGIANYDKWEKGLDFSVNLFLFGHNLAGDIIEWKEGTATVFEQVSTVVGGALDIYGLTEQAVTEGSAKFEV